MKKITALILSVVLSVTALTAFVACGGGDTIVSDEYTEDGKLIVNLFGHDLDKLKAPSADTQAILNIVENKFQIKLDITTVAQSAATSQLAMMIGSGNVPDLFIHFKDQPSYSTWIRDEYLMDYSEYLGETYPNLTAAFGALGNEVQVKTYLGGSYYSYPIIQHRNSKAGDLTAECAMYYRRDWYEALVAKNYKTPSGESLKDPEAADFDYNDFYDLLEAYTIGDPDGNGVADTTGYSLCKDNGVYWWYPFFNMFNASWDGWYLDANGDWQPECTSQKMYDCLAYMSKLFDNGYINQDYSTTTTFEVMKTKFTTGKAGVMVYNANWNRGSGTLEAMESFIGKVANSQDMGDVVRGMPVITGVNGKKQILGAMNHYAYLGINNDITDNKKEKILSLLDWLLSDEATTLMTWGVENTHYKVEDGQKISILGLDARGDQKLLIDDTVAPGVYRLKGLVSWEVEFTNDPRPFTEEVDQLLAAWDKQYLFIDELTFCMVDYSYATIQADLENKLTAVFKNIVGRQSGDENARKAARDELWNSFVSYYDSNGKDYIAAMNACAEGLGL